MKTKMLIALLLAALLTNLNGCSLSRMEENLDAVGDMVEERVDAGEDALQTAALPESSQATSGPTLTREQAEAIALEHAGFTADQVSYLRTEYEIDDGIPQYEVSFHEGRWEYDYEINAETGAILSYDRDD